MQEQRSAWSVERAAGRLVLRYVFSLLNIAGSLMTDFVFFVFSKTDSMHLAAKHIRFEFLVLSFELGGISSQTRHLF